MQKIVTYILIIAASFSLSAVSAQGLIQMKNITAERTGNTLNLNADLSLATKDFESQTMLTLTPMLINGSDTLDFEPITLVGKKRATALKRQVAFGDGEKSARGEVISMGKNAGSWIYPLALTTDYRDWMTDAKFVLHEDICGCARQHGFQYSSQVGDPLFNRPAFQFSYLEPPVEEIKQRSETHSAYINFVVAKYDLLPRYKNNERVLKEVDEIVTELRDDSNLTITELNITGYASPEANYDFNMKLSENRAKSFVSYLKNKYTQTIPAELMTISWKGEDWDGLRKQVKDSDLADKAAILEILNEPDNATRKNKLKQLNGGHTYTGLLKNYYPVLRRTEYTVAYVSKPFNLQEAREVIKTKPQYLSLNEMFQVANSYPKNSREFKETMDVINRYYPNNEIAVLNEAISQIERGIYSDAVLQKLQRIDRPEAWSALGVAYYQQGDYIKSAQFFRKAADSGLVTGVKNAESYKASMFTRF